MSEHEIPPLDADVLALLEKAKPIPAIEAPAREALFAAIAARVGPLPPGGGGGDGGGGGAPPGSGTFATTATRAALALLGTFAVGVAVGVGVDRMGGAEPAPAVTTSVALPAPSTTLALPLTSTEPTGVPVDTLPSVRPVAVAKSAATVAPVVSARGLAAERALLDVARGALARGEPNEALVAAERHQREYADGALVEEREAIAIKALVALGRRDEARTRATAFERKFPNGLMLRAVKSAVDPAP